MCRPVLQILTLFQIKNVIFHTRVQSWPLKSIPILRPSPYSSKMCIIGKVQIIKDGNNFWLSCLEEQRLVALLQGSTETDDSPASDGDEEEWEQAQTDNFSEPIRFEAGRIVL